MSETFRHIPRLCGECKTVHSAIEPHALMILMAKESIKVIKNGAEYVNIRRDRMADLQARERRAEEIRKLKDLCLTMAKRLEELEREERAA
jgi:Na+-translocating ferredoxin:NAD+ oxidoreductase RnfC subunit